MLKFQKSVMNRIDLWGTELRKCENADSCEDRKSESSQLSIIRGGRNISIRLQVDKTSKFGESTRMWSRSFGEVGNFLLRKKSGAAISLNREETCVTERRSCAPRRATAAMRISAGRDQINALELHGS